MSAPLHAAPTPDQRQALLDLRHDPELQPRVRLRVEALLLSAGGLKVPQLAVHIPIRLCLGRRAGIYRPIGDTPQCGCSSVRGSVNSTGVPCRHTVRRELVPASSPRSTEGDAVGL